MDDEAWDEGLAISGDLLAVLASPIPLVGSAMASISQAFANHEMRKRLTVLEAVVKRFEDRLDTLEESLKHKDQQNTLFLAMEVAPRVSDGQPFDLLVDIVADGLDPQQSAQQQNVRLLIDTVSQLQQDHILVLRELGVSAVVSDEATMPHMALKRTIHSLESRLPNLQQVIDPVLARLVGLGLAYQTGTVYVSTPGRPAPQPQWGLTQFGLRVVGHVQSPEK